MQHTWKVGDKVVRRLSGRTYTVEAVLNDYYVCSTPAFNKPQVFKDNDLLPPAPTVVFERRMKFVPAGYWYNSSEEVLPFEEAVLVQRFSDGTWKIEKVA